MTLGRFGFHSLEWWVYEDGRYFSPRSFFFLSISYPSLISSNSTRRSRSKKGSQRKIRIISIFHSKKQQKFLPHKKRNVRRAPLSSCSTLSPNSNLPHSHSLASGTVVPRTSLDSSSLHRLPRSCQPHARRAKGQQYTLHTYSLHVWQRGRTPAIPSNRFASGLVQMGSGVCDFEYHGYPILLWCF